MKPEQLLARVGPAVGWVVAAIASWALGKAADAHVDWLLKPSVLAPTLLVAAGLASLAWWHRTGQKADALRNTFALFKAAQELQPEDVRFQRFEPGAQLKPGFRPFHEKYFERVAVSRAEPGSISIAGEGSKSQTTWTERALVEELRAGRGVLLIGKPTEGKTRTMFEMVRALTDWMVVVPDPVKSPLDDEAFGLLEGCDVVCMIDDLNDFVGKPLDLPDFCLSASKRAQRFVIAATCRDGPEFSALAQAHLSPQRRILEMLPLQLHLQPATEADKKALRAAVPSGGDAIPTTLGSICMRGAYEMMRMRFEAFDGSTKDCHRAIQLLAVAGIRQITIGRAYCAWRSLWNRTEPPRLSWRPVGLSQSGVDG